LYFCEDKKRCKSRSRLFGTPLPIKIKKEYLYIYKKRKVATQYCFGHNTMKNSTARRKQIKLISAIINYTKAFLINLSCWGSYETPTLHLI
jgi:hypothetical protein